MGFADLSGHQRACTSKKGEQRGVESAGLHFGKEMYSFGIYLGFWRKIRVVSRCVKCLRLEFGCLSMALCLWICDASQRQTEG